MADEERDDLLLPQDSAQEDDAGDPAAAPETDEPTCENIGENRWRWSDGVITDDYGEPVDDETETPAPRASAPAPAAAPVEPKPVTATAPAASVETAPRTATEAPQAQRAIYTRDALRAAIYTPEVKQQLNDYSLTGEVDKMVELQSQLMEQHAEATRRLNAYASDLFEKELDSVAQHVPTVVEKFGRQIARRKEQLTPEQLQQPGMARHVAAQVFTEFLAENPLAFEEMVQRALPGAGATGRTAAPVPPAPPAKRTPPRLIPREERLAGPGTARRPEPSRKPAAGNTRDELVNHYLNLYPGTSLDEAKAWAEEMRNQDAMRRRVRQ